MCKSFSNWILLWGVFVIMNNINLSNGQIAGQYRICVPDVLFTVCQQMVADAASQGGRFECVPGNDKIDCIGRVTKGEADIVILEPEEVYVAHRFFHDAFYIATEIRTSARQAGSFQYEPVAIVRNSAKIRSLKDLQGKRSCHTAFGRTSGWEVPLSRLMLKNVMVKDCSLDLTTVEREIASASHFFGDSCVPGKWAPDDKTDAELKQRYPRLCSRCNNPRRCGEDDRHSGFRGALRCLTENNGDVAWTRLETVYQYFGNIPQTPTTQAQDAARALASSEYSFLCPDGNTVPISTTSPCTWAGRPWRSFLVTNRLSAPTTIADIQQQISLYRSVGASLVTSTPAVINWLGDILEFRTQDVEFHVPPTVANTVTPLAYLDRGNYTMTIEKPTCPNRRTIRACVTNEIEKLKCMAFRMASHGRRILPYFDCVVGESKEDCMRKIAIGQADFTSVDARQAYVASRKMRLTPILSEAERFGDEETDAARYAVAVVRADSGIQTIIDLRGKRSCHGSVSSLTGWNIPLIVLRDSGLIYPFQCQYGRALSSFFTQSCVPGARDPNLRLPESLCSVCVGASLDAPALATEESFCANNELEGFYGDLGAFRCLPTLAADVAFVDHLTPLLNTDGLANATWAAGLLSANFRLICPVGTTSRPVTDFRQCHWGKIPSDKVITGEDKDYVEREDIRLTLLKASETFHPEQTVLRLFGPYYGVSNLMFKDIATGLVPLSDDGFGTRRIDAYGRYVNANKDVVYDQQYANRIIRDIDDCNSSQIPHSTFSFSVIISFAILLYLLS